MQHSQTEQNENRRLRAEMDALREWVAPFRPLIQAEEQRQEQERIETEKLLAKQKLEADNVAKGVSMLDSSW